jgi:DNA-binding transcriptional ArsR family regulator
MAGGTPNARAVLGMGRRWRFRPLVASFGPSGLHRRALFTWPLSLRGYDGRVLQRQRLVDTMYHGFMKTASGNMQQGSEASVTGWDFLTNHAHVLTCVAHDPGIRLREIAAAVGITERAAHRVLSELVEEGYVLRERQGRRNRYQVKPELPLRHPLVQEREVGDLLEVLLTSAPPATARPG